MTKKKVTMSVTLVVTFDDDGVDDLNNQAYIALYSSRINFSDVHDIELLGEITDV